MYKKNAVRYVNSERRNYHEQVVNARRGAVMLSYINYE
jgi:hypothetical protein